MGHGGRSRCCIFGVKLCMVAFRLSALGFLLTFLANLFLFFPVLGLWNERAIDLASVLFFLP